MTFVSQHLASVLRPSSLSVRPPRTPAVAFLVLLLLFGAFGCAPDGSTSSDRDTEESQLSGIFADSYPVYYLVDRISGGVFDTESAIPDGENPEYWLPPDAVVAKLQQARLLVLNGADLSAWVELAVLPEERILETASAFQSQWIEMEGSTHSHGPEGEHSHAGIAPFTWLDPLQAIEQAKTIRDAVSELAPQEASGVKARYEVLRLELTALHEKLEAAASLTPDRPLIASHPLYPYPARRYNWNLVDLYWEPDELPSEDDWKAFDELRREHPAKWMIWEAEPLPEVRRMLAERGVGIVVIDPLVEAPETGDFLAVMQANTEALVRAMTEHPETDDG